jgi:hypothetical protein
MRAKQKDRIEEWQRDHWRAVALCDLIMTATTETEENERLSELRKIKAKWGCTLSTGYDPNYFRPGGSESPERVPQNHRGPAEEYVPTPGSVGADRKAKTAGRFSGTPHER